MSLALYTDHNVDGPLVRQLRRRGVDVVTAYEDGFDVAPDEDVLARATLLGRVLVSEDDDLLRITAAWLDAGRTFSGLFYAPGSANRRSVVLEALVTYATAGESEDLKDVVEYI